MPKSSQKTAGEGQPANQRGKSRFGSSGRSARVVLPERPPRAVDNEIVSILLGADPASLTAQAGDVNSAAPLVTAPPALLLAAAPVAPAPESIAPPPAEAVARAEELPGEPVKAETKEVTTDRRATQPPIVLPSPAPSEAAPIMPGRPADRAARTGIPGAMRTNAQGGSISSFEEFAERWKHGLRKGQLKICEVLYEKTYAVGRTECVTSFSEIGRLSGLKMRQCFNIIAQLEALKFVERSRSTDTSNKKDQGSVIRFYLFPIQ